MYLLFSGAEYGAEHGWKTYTGSFNTLQDLENWLAQSIEEWAQAVKDYKLVKQYHRTENGWEEDVG